MKLNKNKVSAIIFISVALILTSFFVWKFSDFNSNQTSETITEQTTPAPQIENLTAEEKIYKELIGNLTNSVYESEKKQIQSLINEIVNIENSGNDNSKKSDVYKKIIKILDEITLRAHSQENLSEYKKYYDNVQKSKDDSLTPEMYQYTITNNGEIADESLNYVKTKNATHNELWKKTKKIIPFELLKGIKYFCPFEANKSSGKYVAGFMQPINFEVTPYEWCIGVESKADEKKDLPYILIHEYGHYISLKDTSLKLTDGFSDIKAEGGELLQSFVETCLGHISDELENIDANNHYLFYARHKDDFVTKYAAVNLLEDFAESFAKFVKDSNYESETLKKKMNFLNNRQDLVEIKNKILNNLKRNGIEEILDMTQ